MNIRSTSYPNTLTKSKEEQNLTVGLIPVSLSLFPEVNPIFLGLILLDCSFVNFTYLIMYCLILQYTKPFWITQAFIKKYYFLK